MQIDLLYFDGCPSWQAGLENLKAVLAEEGVDADIRLVQVEDNAEAEGTKLIELDRTEIFTHLRLFPVIRITAGDEDPKMVEARTCKALQSAQKYSLVANSVKSEVVVEPQIVIVS